VKGREDPTAVASAAPDAPAETPAAGERAELVPRFEEQGYADEAVVARRRFVEERTGARLAHVGGAPLPGQAMRGNVENPIGVAQVPIGVAGPLEIAGEHAIGRFYVPLATTEGALVRSYERGMMAITRAGGAVARVVRDENRASPIFRCEDVGAAVALARGVSGRLSELRAAAEATTRHGRLLRAEARPIGREVVVELAFSTGDAHGMNMIVKAADAACRLLAAADGVRGYTIFSGAESEKRASGALLLGGKGKTAIAGVRLRASLVRAYLHASPEAMVEVWRSTALGHLAAGSLGYNGHLANGLTALFIACGQDVANVANAAVGITAFECTEEGDLYASVTLPALTVATVGGGTGRGTGREGLEMLGCAGSGGARKLAEIAVATALAGELSMGGALASGEFVAAHETYGRNRPAGEEPGGGAR